MKLCSLISIVFLVGLLTVWGGGNPRSGIGSEVVGWDLEGRDAEPRRHGT
jgi:hypothetical protein